MIEVSPCPGCDRPESCSACWLKLTKKEQRRLLSGRRAVAPSKIARIATGHYTATWGSE